MSRFPQADKKFGQHFLHSPQVIKAIVSDRPQDAEAIIEVGPGPAVLTPHLKEHGLPLYLFEMDKRFKETLEAVVGEENLLLADALTVDWNDFLRRRKIKKAWLVSNLPYNVSVPLTLAFMKCPMITRMTLMYQKEVAEKFLPRSGKNTMSSLNALAGIFFHTKRVADVPPGAFQPPPKVMSQVLSFNRLDYPLMSLECWDKLEPFLRLIFQAKRKQLQGLLKERISKDVLNAFFVSQNLEPGIRAEALSLEQLVKLWELDQRHTMV
jgi:16S rRNA (adenine1518-N6/adenine1519-N6)-dimethyltransferase